MERKLLIAVDDSLPSKNAVRYAAHMMAGDPEARFDLLNVQPAISDFLLDEARRKAPARRKLDQLFAKNAACSHEILDGFKQVLVATGIAEDRIGVHTGPRHLGVDKDILDFGVQRRYDTIVMGRRGASGLKDVLFGSVSSNVIQQSKILPVWVIDGDLAPGNILVAVDGSINTMRAVDHLAFMMAGRRDCRFTFFHVQPKLHQFCAIDFDSAELEPLEAMVASGDERCIKNFYGKMRHILAEFDIGEDRVEIKTRSGLGSVGSMIYKEITDGGYDTVVMGRRGIGRSYFMGSVTQYLLGKTGNRALWIIP
jgi:nucleotide-binding universal stress UspA family protein